MDELKCQKLKMRLRSVTGSARRRWWCRTIKSFSNFSTCWVVLCFLLINCSTTLEALHALSPRVVFTKQGPVQGILGPGNIRPQMSPSTFNFRNYGSLPVVEIFKGIPYASPPVGSLRYESPAPLTPRSKQEVYSANITKPPCPRYHAQVLNRTNYPHNPLRALKRTMDLEDCLYLDIYAPLNTDKNRGQGLAVLVYVNSQDDDPEDPFDGSSMAALGNVIVISFRYRVGVLGFLQPGFSEDVRSNFGLWDQLAALQWIKINIEEFGGDPNQICLMAYDMDATLAGLLALSPVSQAYDGLFHRLILLNGSPFAPNSINMRPLETTFQLARGLKCPLDDRTGGLVHCLRRVTTPQLLAAAESVGNAFLSYPFAPNVDGTIVREDVSQNGQSNMNKEMLGKYDLLCGLKEGPFLSKVGRPALGSLTLDKFVTAALKMIMKMEPGSEPTESVKREMTTALLNEYGPAPNIRELVSDFLMIQPMMDLLNSHSQSGRNTFFYVFKDYDPLRKNKHDEISYIFSGSVYRWKYIESQPNYNLQPFQLLISLLANFVRTGDPNTIDPGERFESAADLSQKPSKWMKYTAESGRYLEIGKGVQFPSAYRRQAMSFWATIIPSIIHPFSKLQNQSANNYDSFPPYHHTNVNHHNGISGSNPNNDNNSPYPHFTNNNRNLHGIYTPNVIVPVEEPPIPTMSGIGSNTVILIGCILLLLNFLCFMGLFYQRERLKKAELQLRKRYLQTQKAVVEDSRNSHEMEGSSYYEREGGVATAEDAHVQPIRMLQPMRPMDAMSETETENGFGADFLSPNYDPRTKVNRWMNMQNRLKTDESFDRPTPSPDYLNLDNKDQALMMMPNLNPPMHIRVSSLQRNFQPPKAVAEQPVQFLPPFPYQQPYEPNHLLVSDIPYADSRATSPSVISAPATYSNNNNRVPPQQKQQFLPSGIQQTVPNNHSIIIPSFETDSCPSKSPNPSNRTLSPQPNPPVAPKRQSVLIVRDLDPVDTEVENSGPKFVPVKTGTLKRSVGVDTAHEYSAPRDLVGESGAQTQIQKVSTAENGNNSYL